MARRYRPLVGIGSVCVAGGWIFAAAAQPTSAGNVTPAPVKPGLWTVQILTTFAPDPQPGASDWPGLPGKPRASRYNICLDEVRARVPMTQPRVGLAAGVKTDARSVQVSNTETRSGPSAAQSLEWLYRRLSERAFEGSQTITERNVSMTTAYHASFEASDCGSVKPRGMSAFGEP